MVIVNEVHGMGYISASATPRCCRLSKQTYLTAWWQPLPRTCDGQWRFSAWPTRRRPACAPRLASSGLAAALVRDPPGYWTAQLEVSLIG